MAAPETRNHRLRAQRARSLASAAVSPETRSGLTEANPGRRPPGQVVLARRANTPSAASSHTAQARQSDRRSSIHTSGAPASPCGRRGMQSNPQPQPSAAHRRQP